MRADPVFTVVTAAANPLLVDLATVKDDLGLAAAASPDDAFLTRAITRATAAVSSYCNRTLVVETVQDAWSGSGIGSVFGLGVLSLPPGPLQLTRYPVSSITSVVENGDNLNGDANAGPLDYAVDQASGELYRYTASGSARPWALGRVTVVYAAGYDPVPADLQDAVVRLVAGRYFSRGRDPAIKSDTVPGVQSYSFASPSDGLKGSLPPDVEGLLESYRVPVVG